MALVGAVSLAQDLDDETVQLRRSWHEWESLGGELAGDPAASSWGADRLDVFAPGRDGQLWHRFWDGTQWVPLMEMRLKKANPQAKLTP